MSVPPSSPYLPAALPVAGVERCRATADPTKPHLGKVLLLEDDPGFRELLSVFLTEKGYDVVAVTNGVEGLQEALAGDFALVLCDWHMPSLNGNLFFREIERVRPALCERFVFMTGYRESDEVDQFIASVKGIILIKPFEFRALLEIFTALQRRINLLAA